MIRFCTATDEKRKGNINMTNKKTIWCISKYASTPKYGVGAKLFYVAREFSEMGHNVLLIGSDSNHLAKYPKSEYKYNFEQYGKLKYMWIKTYKYVRSASIKRFISWLDFEFKLYRFNFSVKKKPDIVIVSSLSLLTVLFGIYLKKRYNSKLVFEIRDIHPLTLIEEFGVNKFNPMVLFLGMIEKIGYKNADLIVGTMPNLKEHVKKTTKKDKDVFHSPLGIHRIWRQPFRINESINKLFPGKEKFVVGYAGSIGISNAMLPFINAIIKLSKEKNIYFVIVGDGDLKNKYRDMLSASDNVTIGPKINQEDIPYFLSRCDLLYLSTHDSKVWEYGQSLNKLIDYMMSAKPVIASYSGYQSMLNEANSGIFIPTNDTDAIISAIKKFKNMSEEERIEYGVRGREWVLKNHDYKNIAKRYIDKIMSLYKKTLD